ncbi:MAG: hypothetical protein ACK4NW_10650 [Roseinatronobacter sp.]
MSGLLSRFTTRGASALGICALVVGLTMTAPTQARAADWVTIAAGAAFVGLVFTVVTRPQHKPTHTVIARYCHSAKTGLYHKC